MIEGAPSCLANPASGGPATPRARPPGLSTVSDFSRFCPPRRVDHEVVAGQRLGEVLRLVVDDDVGPETSDEVCGRGGGGGRDDGAEVLGELDDRRAEAAGPGVDEDLLPGLHVCAVDEHLPGGQGDERHSAGFLERQGVRLGRDVVLVDRDEFGEGTDPQVARAGVDLVTHREVTNVGADVRDDAGQVVAEDEGRPVPDQPLEVPVAGHRVERVDACGTHRDEDVASSHGGLGHVGGAQAVLAELCGLRAPSDRVGSDLCVGWRRPAARARHASPGEVAPPLRELTPRSRLDDPAPVEDDDSVGLRQRGRLAGRADDGRPAGAQGCPELDLGGRIERRGDVVGQQQVSLAGERSGEGQPLHLTAGETDPAVADEGVGSAGLGDVPLHTGRRQCRLDQPVGVVEGDVAGEGAGQHPRHLGDVGDPAGPQLDLRLGKGAAVPEHLPGVGGQPGQRREQAGLAGADLAQQEHQLALPRR